MHMALFAARMGLRDDAARDRIKGWFLQSKMTQKKFASKIGWTQPTISSFLLGNHNTDLDTLAAMAKVFGRTLADVVGEDDVEASELTALFNAVDEDVQKAALVVLRASKRNARPSGSARRSVRPKPPE